MTDLRTAFEEQSTSEISLDRILNTMRQHDVFSIHLEAYERVLESYGNALTEDQKKAVLEHIVFKEGKYDQLLGQIETGEVKPSNFQTSLGDLVRLHSGALSEQKLAEIERLADSNITPDAGYYALKAYSSLSDNNLIRVGILQQFNHSDYLKLSNSITALKADSPHIYSGLIRSPANGFSKLNDVIEEYGVDELANRYTKTKDWENALNSDGMRVSMAIGGGYSGQDITFDTSDYHTDNIGDRSRLRVNYLNREWGTYETVPLTAQQLSDFQSGNLGAVKIIIADGAVEEDVHYTQISGTYDYKSESYAKEKDGETPKAVIEEEGLSGTHKFVKDGFEPPLVEAHYERVSTIGLVHGILGSKRLSDGYQPDNLFVLSENSNQILFDLDYSLMAPGTNIVVSGSHGGISPVSKMAQRANPKELSDAKNLDNFVKELSRESGYRKALLFDDVMWAAERNNLNPASIRCGLNSVDLMKINAEQGYGLRVSESFPLALMNIKNEVGEIDPHKQAVLEQFQDIRSGEYIDVSTDVGKQAFEFYVEYVQDSPDVDGLNEFAKTALAVYATTHCQETINQLKELPENVDADERKALESQINPSVLRELKKEGVVPRSAAEQAYIARVQERQRQLEAEREQASNEPEVEENEVDPFKDACEVWADNPSPESQAALISQLTTDNFGPQMKHIVSNASPEQLTILLKDLKQNHQDLFGEIFKLDLSTTFTDQQRNIFTTALRSTREQQPAPATPKQ